MTSTTADIAIERDSATRQHKLAAAVRGLRTKAGSDDGAKTLLIVGGVLVPLGFIFIILGWLGASHTVNLYEQIPYSISGGTIGLGMIFAGGFAYFAYWLTQLVYAARHDAADTRAVLERIEALLASNQALAATAPAAAAPAPARRRTVTAEAMPFLATPTGTMFHRPDCPAVAGREGLRKVSGGEAGLTPCRICEPTA